MELPPSLWPTLHRVAAGESWPPSSGVTVKRLLARAAREGLLSLLFADPGLPPIVRTMLESLRLLERMNTRHIETKRAAACRLSEVLHDEPFIFLKGMDYAYRLYAHPALRPMGDVDILVPHARMAAVGRRLTGAGFTPMFSGAVTELPSYHEKLFRLGDVYVDVHHSFVQRSRTRVDYDGVWARKVPLAGPGFSAYRLSDVDALVYHAFAMAVKEFVVPLGRYVDLWLLIGAAPECLEAAATRARAWGVERALYGALRLAVHVCPELVARGASRVAGTLLGPWARRFLDRCVLPEPLASGEGGGLNRPVQLWRKLWLMDGLRPRAAFALYHGYALVRTRHLAGAEGAAPAEAPAPADLARAGARTPERARNDVQGKVG